MTNPYGVVLDEECLRWAAAESVSEAVIAAICLLETRSVDEIVARLTPAELEQVIKIVGRCPRCYPPGAYDALKARRTPSQPQPRERTTPGPERSHRSAEQSRPATKHAQRWIPPRRFAGFGSKAPQSTTKRAAANRYGITLDPTWTEWAAKQGVSETIAAALYIISEGTKTDRVVGKLTPGEIERVINIVQHWPDRFPPGTLAAITRSIFTPSPEQSATYTSPGAGHRPAARFNPGIPSIPPGPNGLPSRACPKRSRRRSTSSPRVRRPTGSWVSSRPARSSGSSTSSSTGLTAFRLEPSAHSAIQMI
jgi:hypothetical protein